MQKIDVKEMECSEHTKQLLISEEYYEYRMFASYRELHNYDAYLVGIAGFYAKVMCLGGSMIVVSLIFPKAWRMEEIAEWLYGSNICIAQENEQGYFVEGADHILGGVFFKGKCIVAYGPGTETVYCWDDTYVDAGKLYGEEKCAVDVMFPKPTSSITICSYQENYKENPVCIPADTPKRAKSMSKVYIEVQGDSKVSVTIN